MALYRCKAPLRISFAGGGTDVDPYRSQFGGCTLSTTIDKYAYVTCQPRNDGVIQVQSLDYDIVAKYDAAKTLQIDGELDLAKAVIERLREPGSDKGFDLFMHTDAPPGSGLGASSTVVVALINLFKDYFQRPMTPYEIAHLAFTIERIDLGLKGGMQDQYCATFGGFNFIEYSAHDVVVAPIRLPLDVVNELHYRLVLCYTGQTRLSAGIIDEQMDHIANNDTGALEATHALKALCIDMKNALLRGKLREFGELLHESWQQKKRIAGQITNPQIDTLYEEARKHGAIGGKLLGAGGGGYLLVLAPFDRKHIILERLEAAGGQPVDFNFDLHGAVTWRVTE